VLHLTFHVVVTSVVVFYYHYLSHVRMNMSHYCYEGTVVKCHWSRLISVSTNKMVEILYSDAKFAVAQCVIKSSIIYSDSDFIVHQCVVKSSTLCCEYICIYTMSCFNHPLLWAYIKTCPPTMHLHTSFTHYHVTHVLPPWTWLTTWSPHGTSAHSAAVVNEQRLPSPWCRPHMEGDVEFVLTLTQVAT
jgi:hypothetical protein